MPKKPNNPPSQPFSRGGLTASPIKTTATIRPDKRKSLCVPAQLIRALGLAHGALAFISWPNSSSLMVSREVPKTLHVQYTVDKHCNVRIGRKTSRNLGDLKKSYEVELLKAGKKDYVSIR